MLPDCRTFLSLLLTLTLTLLAPGSWADDPPAAESKKLTVMLDWFVNPDHAALVVAQQKGFFAAQNLEVELQTPADPNDPPKLAAAGKVNLAITYQPQLMMHVTAGLPIKRIGTLIATPLNTLVAVSYTHLDVYKRQHLRPSAGAAPGRDAEKRRVAVAASRRQKPDYLPL